MCSIYIIEVFLGDSAIIIGFVYFEGDPSYSLLFVVYKVWLVGDLVVGFLLDFFFGTG